MQLTKSQINSLVSEVRKEANRRDLPFESVEIDGWIKDNSSDIDSFFIRFSCYDEEDYEVECLSFGNTDRDEVAADEETKLIIYNILNYEDSEM